MFQEKNGTLVFENSPSSKAVIESYNYLDLEIVNGEYPNDNTNEILIETDYADDLINEGVASSYEELIGKTIYFPNIGISDFEEATFVISGIYHQEGGATEYKFYTSYSGVENKLVTEGEYNADSELNQGYSSYDEYVQNYYNGYYLYIMTDSPQSAEEVTKEINNSFPSIGTDLYDDVKYSTIDELFSCLFFIMLLIVCYAIVVFIISIIGRLILIKSHKKLQGIGYKRKEIVLSNIKQNFKHLTIAIVVILIPFIYFSSFNIIFVTIMIFLLLVSYLSIALANLIMNRFIK